MLVQKEITNAYIGIPNPESIVLDKSSISLTTVGQTEQLTATVEPTISDQSITWSTSDATVATVSTSGLVTCVTPGTATITATTVNGLTASCSVSDNQGWQPGINTVLYMPLDSTNTSTDLQGNTTTNTNVTFGTNYGVDCGYFGGNAHIQVTPFLIPSDVTFLCWCYNNAVTSSDAKIFDGRNGSNWYINLYGVDGGGPGYFLWLISGQTSESNHLIQGEWVLFSTTVTNGSQNVYVKGNNIDLHYTTANSFSSFTPSSLNVGNEYNNGASRYWKGGLSQLILEDKIRTATEVNDYFNQTKSLYGIS